MMNVDYAPRQHGKTTRAILWLGEADNRWLIVHNDVTKRALQNKFLSLKDRIITLQDYINARCYGYEKEPEFFIDNADLVLQSIIREKLYGISLSKEGEPNA
jgi:hypothetical protein